MHSFSHPYEDFAKALVTRGPSLIQMLIYIYNGLICKDVRTEFSFVGKVFFGWNISIWVPVLDLLWVLISQFPYFTLGCQEQAM